MSNRWTDGVCRIEKGLMSRVWGRKKLLGVPST
jgi:hypothetical protein